MRDRELSNPSGTSRPKIRHFGIRAIISAIICAAAILCFGAGGVSADNPAPFLGYTKLERYHADYYVDADGTDVETVDYQCKVLTNEGVSQANRGYISYSDQLATAKLLQAYTLKKDGRRIEVPRANFQEQVNTGRNGASPFFTDVKTMTVAFPEVEVGDSVVLKYRIIQHKPTLPGNFSFIESFSQFYVYDDAEVSMSAPDSLKIQVEARSVKGGEIKNANGRRYWQWSYRNEQIPPSEPGSVSALDYGPMVAASTFTDYRALAAVYYSQVKSKSKPDDQIRKLADELTRGAHTPREQAEALYNWVTKNIAYAENDAGLGAVVPHDAAVVLKNRMGDCKDHATLYGSLLAAKGIASTSVLINGSDAYTLPEVPALGVFNHLITYIPSLKLYADTTTRFTPFGSLPLGDSDKPVVLLSGYDGIQHTPPTDWKDNGTTTVTEMTINPDGSAEGETKYTLTGSFATNARAAMSYLQPNMEQELVRSGLAANGFAGTGTVEKDNPQIQSDTYHWGVKFKITDAMNLPGPGAFAIRPPVSGNVSLPDLLSDVNAIHTVNFSCMGAKVRESFTVHLPKAASVMAMPSNNHFSAKDGAVYSSRYEQAGGTITAVREMDDTTPGNVCTPEQAAAFKPFGLRALRDLRAEVLYR